MKISILIPLYNDEKNIKRCLESLLNQTYKNLEIIIVNDGSTDKSQSIVEKYQKKDKRIILINQKNQGVCTARNTLIKNFTGDYALFVDSDDTIDTDTCETLNKILKKNKDIDMITFDFKRDYGNNNFFNKYPNDNKLDFFTGEEATKLYIYKDTKFGMVLWRRLYRKDLLKKVYFEPNLLPEDYATAFFIYKNCTKIIHINRSFYNYYIKEDGLTIRNKIEDHINLYKVTKKIYLEEKEYYQNTKHIKQVNSIYLNYLITIYAKLYISKNCQEKEEYLKKCLKDIKKTNPLTLNKKSIAAYITFSLNKKLTVSLVNRRAAQKIKGR